MIEDKVWNAGALEDKPIAATGRELGELTAAIERGLDEALKADWALNCPDLARPIEDVVRGYSMLRPIFGVAHLPRPRRLAAAHSFGEVLAEVALAEVRLVCTMARARAEFLALVLRADAAQ